MVSSPRRLKSKAMIEYATYNVGTDSQILVLELAGRLDLTSSQFLKDCIKGHIEDGYHHFILDCTSLEYASSIGLGTLVGFNSQVKKLDGAVALAGVQGMFADVIRIAHLDKIFHLFQTVQDAAGSFEESQ
jgi:anti-sigma B factor antagonist